MLLITSAPSETPNAWSTNSGGPYSRTRTERVQRTILARDDGQVRMPRMLRVGLEYQATGSIVNAIEGLLARAGFGSTEQLRAAFFLPPAPLLCRPFVPKAGELVCVTNAPPAAALEQALLLGLCTLQVYDPARPIVWTTASLTRRLELFQPEGFYVS